MPYQLAVAFLSDVYGVELGYLRFVPGHDEAARLVSLSLEPVRAFAGDVWFRQALADNPLGARITGLLKELGTACHDVSDGEDARAPRLGDQLVEDRDPLLQRTAAQIEPVEIKQVKGEKGEPIGPVSRAGVVQPVEMRQARLVWHRNLTVEDHRSAERGQPPYWRRELVGEIIAIPRVDAQTARGIDRHEYAPAVVLDLVQPSVALGRDVRLRADLEIDIARRAARHRRLWEQQLRHEGRQK